MQAYRIVDWKKRFEYTKDKRRADDNTPLDKLRQKAHDSILMKVFGHVLGPGYRTVIDKAWKAGECNELAVMGQFLKLCEIAADQDDPKHRGWLLDHNQQPMDIKQTAELLNIQCVSRFKDNMMVLIEVGWLENCEYPVSLQNLQSVAKIAEGSAPPGDDCKPLIHETETETTEHNIETTGPQNDSILPPTDSDSDSRIEDSKNAQFFLLGLTEIIPGHWTGSDHTTLANIAEHITKHGENYAKVLREIKAALGNSRSINNRRAFIVDFCKKRYGFQKTVQKYVRN
ncbi:MAG: hypothetical protein PHY02_09675 [Phycisphaerae bacterium]|nr:hypothetical protein [Phycisphaerae bacterium]